METKTLYTKGDRHVTSFAVAFCFAGIRIFRLGNLFVYFFHRVKKGITPRNYNI